MKSARVLLLISTLTLALFSGFPKLYAQDFTLTVYNTQDELDDQVKPILQLFGSLAGGGLANSASLHKIGGIDIGLTAVVAMVPDEYKDIIPTGGNDVFANTSLVPLPFLNASVGLLGNLDVMGRFITFPLGDRPSSNTITLAGLGVKYGILQAPLLPKIMIVGAYHGLFVPKDFDFGTVRVATLKAYVSYGFAIFEVYAGGGADRTDLKVEFPADHPTLPGFKRNFSATQGNGIIGLTVKPIPFLRVNGDYNFGKFPNFSVGASLSFR